MRTKETRPDDAATDEADSTTGRRQFVRLWGSAVAVGLSGCGEVGVGGDAADRTAADAPSGSTPANRGNESSGPTDTASNGTAESGESDPATSDGDEADGTGADGETATEAEEGSDGGAGEDVHAHGTLSLEVDGRGHPFTDPKYYHPDEHPDARATERFHFHDDGHDRRWHMHGERLTLAAALGDLPDVDYESKNGVHVVHFEGETYQDGRDGTAVEIRQGQTTVDSAEFELYDGDEIHVEITTGDGGD